MFNKIRMNQQLAKLEGEGWKVERVTVARNKQVAVNIVRGTHHVLIRYTANFKLKEVVGSKGASWEDIYIPTPYTETETTNFITAMKG